jgi:hypothetical protein
LLEDIEVESDEKESEKDEEMKRTELTTHPAGNS